MRTFSKRFFVDEIQCGLKCLDSHQIGFQAPHFRSTQILIFECYFDGVQCNRGRINFAHNNFGVCSEIECSRNACFNANVVYQYRNGLENKNKKCRLICEVMNHSVE